MAQLDASTYDGVKLRRIRRQPTLFLQGSAGSGEHGDEVASAFEHGVGC